MTADTGEKSKERDTCLTDSRAVEQKLTRHRKPAVLQYLLKKRLLQEVKGAGASWPCQTHAGPFLQPLPGRRELAPPDTRWPLLAATAGLVGSRSCPAAARGGARWGTVLTLMLQIRRLRQRTTARPS